MVDDSCWISGGHSSPGVFRYMPRYRLHSHSTPGILILHLACDDEPLSPFRSQGLLRPKYKPTLNHYEHTDPPSKLWWFAWPSTHYRYHTPITARDSHAMRRLTKCHTSHRSTHTSYDSRSSISPYHYHDIEDNTFIFTFAPISILLKWLLARSRRKSQENGMKA